MNQGEYEALDAETLPLEAVALYVRGFRRYMSYDTGLTLVSLASMRQRIEFVPPVGSTARPCKPTVQKVRSLIDSLVRHGLIRLVERGDKHTRKPAVFLCVLASSDLVRLNEEQHENNTRTTRRSNTGNVVNLKARRVIGENLAKSEEQHSSVISEQEDIYTREDLIFCDQFRAMAGQALLNVCDAELFGYFDAFKFSVKDDGAVKPLYVHLKAWRQYCVSIRNNLVKNGGKNEICKPGAGVDEPKSATARTILRGLKRAQDSYDGQWDEIG
jgi:hypothetical protein